MMLAQTQQQLVAETEGRLQALREGRGAHGELVAQLLERLQGMRNANLLKSWDK